MARGLDGASRTPVTYRMCRCIGSRCNWWEWKGRVEPERLWCSSINSRLVEELERPIEVPASYVWVPFKERDEEGITRWAHWIEPMDEAARRRKGYCGLVGSGS